MEIWVFDVCGVRTGWTRKWDGLGKGVGRAKYREPEIRKHGNVIDRGSKWSREYKEAAEDGRFVVLQS